MLKSDARGLSSLDSRHLGEPDESVIGRIVAAQREEQEREIGELKVEADRKAEEAKDLVGKVPF
jgi:hypothetical protein